MLGNVYGRSENELCQGQCYRLSMSRTGGKSLERVSDRHVDFAEFRPVFKWDGPTGMVGTAAPVLISSSGCGYASLMFEVVGYGLSYALQLPTAAKRDEGDEEVGFVYRSGHGNGDLPSNGHHTTPCLIFVYLVYGLESYTNLAIL